MSNLTCDLLNHERIKTTTPKAKELRRYAERMITLGKKNTLASRRRAMAFLRDKALVTKLFADIAPRFADRKGGYTRILKVGVRDGDCAPVSLIELVVQAAPETPEEPAKKGKKATPKAKADSKDKKETKPKKAKADAPKADAPKAEAKADEAKTKEEK